MESIKIYSPCRITTYTYFEEFDIYIGELSEFYGGSDYINDISEAMKNYGEDYYEGYDEKGLMTFFNSEGEIYDRIRQKVRSAFVNVTVLLNKNNERNLFTVCELKVTNTLKRKELDIVLEFIDYQYAYMFGANFGELEIKIGTSAEEIQIHLYDNSKFYLKTEKAMIRAGYKDIYSPDEQIV